MCALSRYERGKFGLKEQVSKQEMQRAVYYDSLDVDAFAQMVDSDKKCPSWR